MGYMKDLFVELHNQGLDQQPYNMDANSVASSQKEQGSGEPGTDIPGNSNLKTNYECFRRMPDLKSAWAAAIENLEECYMKIDQAADEAIRFVAPHTKQLELASSFAAISSLRRLMLTYPGDVECRAWIESSCDECQKALVAYVDVVARTGAGIGSVPLDDILDTATLVLTAAFTLTISIERVRGHGIQQRLIPKPRRYAAKSM